jgi:two-component system, chemotaxis family, protein-glutamate methylesterase/glutaminase
LIKLLIVDDSAFMRKIISDMVAQMEGIEVIGIARNGVDALDSIGKLNPDIVTLDVEMPKLNGIKTLKEIKRNYSIPVIMLSSNNKTDTTIEALQIGALDFIEKPKDLNSDLEELKVELEEKIKSVLHSKPKFKKRKRHKVKEELSLFKKNIKIVVIAASTGGPKALVYLISRLPEKIKVPILIVQHMPKNFTTSFANRLDQESNIKVLEAEDRMNIQRNMVYLSPGDSHMTIRDGSIILNQDKKLHGVRPAADYLFQTAAKEYGENTLGIVLTGMGKDGADGMVDIKNSGGFNIAQSEKTCIVYGMPGSAVRKGVVHEIMDLEDISDALNKAIEVR